MSCDHIVPFHTGFAKIPNSPMGQPHAQYLRVGFMVYHLGRKVTARIPDRNAP